MNRRLRLLIKYDLLLPLHLVAWVIWELNEGYEDRARERSRFYRWWSDRFPGICQEP